MGSEIAGKDNTAMQKNQKCAFSTLRMLYGQSVTRIAERSLERIPPNNKTDCGIHGKLIAANTRNTSPYGLFLFYRQVCLLVSFPAFVAGHQCRAVPVLLSGQ